MKNKKGFVQHELVRLLLKPKFSSLNTDIRVNYVVLRKPFAIVDVCIGNQICTGVSRCSDKDTWNEQVGLRIATARVLEQFAGLGKPQLDLTTLKMFVPHADKPDLRGKCRNAPFFTDFSYWPPRQSETPNWTHSEKEVLP